MPNWDQTSQKKVRDALLALAETLPDTKRTFGARDRVDPVRHLIGTAFAFGGNPERDALYLNVTPSKNDGKTVYRLAVKDVPVDAFWSISLYNAEGHFQKNDLNAYSLNSITAQKTADGSVDVQFGGCDGKISNCLPTMPGWNYMVRLYRPSAEVLEGRWRFPEAQPAT
ncbi:mll5468 [Mesorhizobium japonicum MAFF 303099]|uniref:Mll5468 protein n=1 Tax=Mesorhizobium japonicum (strain LMG 29417 / CECT 9101 / MAFF 303099) TaxID=266835 RepID=Q98BQ6_RHILO|nr:mll5468 [Mesorhizobium japonicum MAFF 303099]